MIVRAVCLLSLCATTVSANGDFVRAAYRSPHGGEVSASGAYHLELVVNDNALLVYVTDRSGAAVPVETRGLGGSAFVVSGADRVDVPLRPAGVNLLAGRGSFILDPRMQVTVTIRNAGREAGRAAFHPLSKITP
ncbi:MAG: hypothetical protein GC151_16305 [Betaproteobacteria bacterium]|nr:hypothetical protein [Betaproteobacteria bacterium]